MNESTKMYISILKLSIRFPSGASYIQYNWTIYVIKFVGDLLQVVGFLIELRFPPQIKLHDSMM
jgi:hypothetical protein